MSSDLQKATLQASGLNVLSTILAQLFQAYRESQLPAQSSLLNPLGLDYIAILHFLFWALLSTPPNFLWQQLLERRLPAHPTSVEQKSKREGSPKRAAAKPKISVRNTAIKFALDQTLGAAANTAGFLLCITAVRGGSLADCMEEVQNDFWSLLFAGYKVWPLVSLINFVFVPVERRVVIAAVVGLFWGVYMVLRPRLLGVLVGISQKDVEFALRTRKERLPERSLNVFGSIEVSQHLLLPHHTRERLKYLRNIRTIGREDTLTSANMPFRRVVLPKQSESDRNLDDISNGPRARPHELPDTPTPLGPRSRSNLVMSNSNAPRLSLTDQSAITTPPTPRSLGLATPTQSTVFKISQWSSRSSPRSIRKARSLVSRPSARRARIILLFIGLIMVFLAYPSYFISPNSIAKNGAAQFPRDTRVLLEREEDLHFFSSAHPNIHKYVGRWTPTPNQSRMDGAFPGSYFDLKVSNTSSFLIALYNDHESKHSSVSQPQKPSSPSRVDVSHLSFQRSHILDEAASPVPLIVRIDHDEYTLFPESSRIVNVRSSDMDIAFPHDIRVIFSQVDRGSRNVIQLEGVWLSAGAEILSLNGTGGNPSFGKISKASGPRSASDNGERNSTTDPSPIGLKDIRMEQIIPQKRKVLEIVTDHPGAIGGRSRSQRTGGVDGLLSGVMGWEFLLGEMFSVDHIAIANDGMCLVRDCIGGSGEPNSISDVFFRSGPPDSPYFEHPWMFSTVAPDAMILNLGISDFASFSAHQAQYNVSLWDLYERFEEAYVSLIVAIRQLAYPAHPSMLGGGQGTDRRLAGGDMSVAYMPIFVMRPFTGALEHSTLNVVSRLRELGDTDVHWVDTSGWLVPSPPSSRNADRSSEVPQTPDEARKFFGSAGAHLVEDTRTNPPTVRLTSVGNQRAAVFLHSYVCRFLAANREKCPFLPPSAYRAETSNQAAEKLEHAIVAEKERRLRDLLWGRTKRDTH